MSQRAATVLDSRAVHRGRAFNTHQDRVRLPNGREATMDVVRHPASVILVPLPDPGRVILVRQYRYAVDRWIWELPAGNVEPGEDPEAAARRECAEETGWTARRVERMGAFHPSPGYCDEVMIFYRLTELTATSQLALDADEVLEPRIVTLNEAQRMMAEGPVTDMKTALGLRLLQRAAASPELRHSMLTEDEIVGAWERVHREHQEQQEAIAEQRRILAEQQEAITARQEAIAARDETIEAQRAENEKQRAEIEELRRRLGGRG